MEAMQVDETSLCSTDTLILNPTDYQEIEIPAGADTCSFVFSVVGLAPENDEKPDPSASANITTANNIQNFMPENPPNYINLTIGNTPNEDVFHPNGTLKIVGYDTPLEHHSTSEIQITTPKKARKTGGLSRPSQVEPLPPNSPQPGFSGWIDQKPQTDLDDDPLNSPIYARIQHDKNGESSRKRSTNIPQALPLQKVSRRMDEEDRVRGGGDSGEDEDEVVVWMNGVLTNVGRPSANTSSGKIYSTAQNCPITVKWLLENFESMVGQSLPRSFVYDQYVSHCGVNKIESVNAASFGKLIRSVFLGLRTRRLGTRGNSKYHYYGIKIKESSHLLPILNSIRAEQDLMNDTVNGRIRKRVRRTQSVYTGKHVKGLVIDKKVEIQGNLGSLVYCYPNIYIDRETELPEGIDLSILEIFEDAYRRHCLKLIGFFHEFKLIDVLAEIANFWRLTLTFKRKGLENYSQSLSKPLLFKIVSLEAVEKFVVRMDLHLFQHVINILVTSVLRPVPLQMLQVLDNMIQDVLGLLPVALKGYPKGIAHGKLRTLTAFVRIWKHYSKMSQLSEFMEMTMENEGSIAAMRHDMKSIDLETICDRVVMIVESPTMGYDNILKLMTSFAKTLEMEQSLELWCNWARTEILALVTAAEDPHIDNIEFITADMHSCWLIVSNLVVCTIREMFGSSSSLFVPFLQWCGELMQYFRQRILDNMKQVMPVTRFYMALMNEDMSISFMDKHKPRAKPVATATSTSTVPVATTETQQPEEDKNIPEPETPLLIPTTVRLLNEEENSTCNNETTKEEVPAKESSPRRE